MRRRARRVVGPTPREKEAHEEQGHVPYRSWCAACCAGRGRMDAHRAARSGDLDEMAVVGVDYGYLNDNTSGVVDASGFEQKVGAYPFLAVKDARHRWVAGHIVPGKGREPYAIEVLAGELLGSGHVEVELKSDQEPAILALKEAAAAKVRVQGLKVRLTEAPLHAMACSLRRVRAQPHEARSRRTKRFRIAARPQLQ